MIMPKIAQVARQPTQIKSAAVTIGINTLDRPCPRLAAAMARPRLRTNQREIVTLTTIWHMKTPPNATRSSVPIKTAKTCLLDSRPMNPTPADKAPAVIDQRPP